MKFVFFVFGLLVASMTGGLAQTADPAEPPPIDFSHAGYWGGGVPLPLIPAVALVRPTGGDDTVQLQGVLDFIATRALGQDGFRGALQLAPGTFRVSGALKIRASGVVLRGNTDAKGPSVIVATGRHRRTLLELGAEHPRATGPAVRVTDEHAPAGTRVITVAGLENFQIGSSVVVTRPSTTEWIASLQMNRAAGNFADQRIHWLPGSRNLTWDRTVVGVRPGRRQLILDAPITTALEQRFGGGTVAKARGDIVRNVGVEHLVFESEYDSAHPADEEHAWMAIALDNVEDAWVRGLIVRHFVSSAVRVGQRARRVSVEDCHTVQPVSELGGYRRQSFYIEGQQVLVRRCSAEAGWNDFATGFCAGGPNVFLDCVAVGAHGPSGATESWASGVLYERVRIGGGALRLTYDMERAQGAGWTAANSVVWNCHADAVEVRGPEGAPNVVRTSSTPLFEAQLAARMRDEPQVVAVLPYHSSLPPEFRVPNGAPPKRPTNGALQIVNGRFVVGEHLVWGGQFNAASWKGQVSPAVAAQTSGRSITRFVPGRTGRGLTEHLPQLGRDMIESEMPFYAGSPGLWYDRRRDDHLPLPQQDSNVWAPFFEMPWARSGQGTAWDGLSKYDLSRFNPWFFERTREFAQLCAEHGLVLHHSLYNTHNVLGTYAHYVDYPWRTANCVNDTGIPEPPPIDGRNTVHLNHLVYDVEHAGRRALHQAYILHTLDQLGDNPNVIFSVAFQFTGPLAFQEFFLDTVAEWEKRSGRTVRVALTTSKEITDAILADGRRATQIAVIDTRYWQRQSDGQLWAPRDVNLASRGHVATHFGRVAHPPPDTTPLNVYRGVREYRDRFPDKAIVAWHGGTGAIPILMAGGAQALTRYPAADQAHGAKPEAARVDAFVRERLARILMHMVPRDGWLAGPEKNWCLADDRQNVLVYSLEGGAITLQRDLPGTAHAGVWFNPRTGKTSAVEFGELRAGKSIAKPNAGEWLLLLQAKG